jgi:tRNA(Arg) A34 adenosine deaminase TadA
MDRDNFMRRAIALAEQNVSDLGGGPFGAVVVYDGQIVGEGTNQVTGLHDPTAHAEVVAIRAACTALGSFSLAGCEIYASCEPCPMCLSAIYWARIDRIFFGNTKTDAAAIGFDDDHIYREIALPVSDRSIPTQRLLTDEAIAAFRAWENSDDKIVY